MVKKAALNTMVFNGKHKNLRELPVIKQWSTYIISEHVGEESHHDAVLSRVFLTESTNCLHNHHLQKNKQMAIHLYNDCTTTTHKEHRKEFFFIPLATKHTFLYTTS